MSVYIHTIFLEGTWQYVFFFFLIFDLNKLVILVVSGEQVSGTARRVVFHFFIYFIFSFLSSPFLGPHLRHMEVPWLGV